LDNGASLEDGETLLFNIKAFSKSNAAQMLQKINFEKPDRELLNNYFKKVSPILVEANTKGQTVNLRLANDLASDLFVAHPLFRKDPSWVQKNLADLLVLAGNKRKELLAKIATFDDATLKAFIGDLDGRDDLVEAFAENVDFVKAWKGLFNTGLRTDIPWLTRASKWIDEGGDFVESGGKTWYRKNGDDIFEIKNDKILPNKKEHYHQASDGVEIGTPSNGYQVVKVGDDIKVKRVPDESPYQSGDYLDRLTDHQNAHVLERHGHDVTDDALTKRATTGIAPDGSTTFSGNPPPYSSKFESPDKIKEVLDNVGPGSPNWNPPSSGNNYAFDYPLTGSSPNSFGYGIPSGGGNSEPMNRVKVVYKKDGGVWKLLTMYPQP
jgi:hypothetical protein